jgi:hypothetical protein
MRRLRQLLPSTEPAFNCRIRPEADLHEMGGTSILSLKSAGLIRRAACGPASCHDYLGSREVA